jgi:anaerobic selenocysteine-containing dehydrogenase
VTRDEALALIAERLKGLRAADRPEALALLAGYCAGSVEDVWRQFLTAFGSPNYIADDYRDGTDGVMALMHGVERRPSYDLGHSELVLSFGAPLFEAWWSPLQAFVGFAHPESDETRRSRFIQVDTRFSRTAARAHEWVGVRPGTHAVLALGIAYVLIRDELLELDFIAERVSGFEDFTDVEGQLQEGYRSIVSRNFRTEEVSAITGVPVERITSLARTYAESPAAVAICGSDVTAAPNGLLAGMAVHSVNVITANLNRPGGVLLGDDLPLAPLAPLVLDDTARRGLDRERVAGPLPAFGAGGQRDRFAEAIVGSAAAQVEVLFLYYSNPIASSVAPDVWREALEMIDYVVSFSPFLDETTRHADLVLPDLLPYERWQDAPTPQSYPYPVWGLAQPLVAPHEGGTHTIDAVLEIARALGGGVREALPYDGVETLLRERARGLFAARRGMTFRSDFESRHYEQMESRGWWLPQHTEFDEFWDALTERGGWTDLFYDHTDPGRLARTSDGRVQLMPPGLPVVLDAQGRPRRPYIDVGSRGVAPTDGFPLRLVPYRVSTLASGSLALERWLAEKPGLFPEVHWDPWVEVNPATARSLGLEDDTQVWVESSRGRYRARLKLFLGAPPDHVCAPYGLRHPDGEIANPLSVLDGSIDPLTGVQSWSTTFVRLQRV